MIPPHLFYQIYLSFLEQNDCTPPKCGELSEYTDSAHTQVEDPSLVCMNVSNVYEGHFTVIEPSKFQNKTMKSSNINALFCHTNTKMPENYNFQILVHCYPIIN